MSDFYLNELTSVFAKVVFVPLFYFFPKPTVPESLVFGSYSAMLFDIIWVAPIDEGIWSACKSFDLFLFKLDFRGLNTDVFLLLICNGRIGFYLLVAVKPNAISCGRYPRDFFEFLN